MNAGPRCLRILGPATLAWTLAAAATPAPPTPGGDPAAPGAPMKDGSGAGKDGKDAKPGTAAESAFYERLDKEDRDALQANVGWVIPKPPEAMKWVGGDPMTRQDFRGKVTVIQSVGGKSSPRAALEKTKRSLPEGAVLVGLHTPEQADRAEASLANNPVCAVAVDASGEWCDALGVWKKPVNIVIDKTGAVRFVGLSDAGLKAKLPELLAEEVDESVEARERPAMPGETKPAPEATAPKWPEFTGSVPSAADMRGKRFPGLTVSKWISARPDAGTRLLAIDFCAMKDGQSRATVPHLNELSKKYGKDVLFVGISDEKEPVFTAALKKNKLQPSTFAYSIGIDTAATLKDKFFHVTALPHMAIMSPDGVVRWQGATASLEASDLEKLIAANKASAAPAAGGAAKGGRGWAASGSGQKSR